MYSRTALLFSFWLPIVSYFKKSLSGLESHTGRVHLSSCGIKQYVFLYSPIAPIAENLLHSV